MNKSLARAMEAAGYKPHQLAARIGVSGKTVGRWLADEDQIPYPTNRADAAAVLGVDESMLWPKLVRQSVKVGPDRELVATYPYRSACPSNVWADLAQGAEREIFLSGYTNYFFWTQIPDFAGLVRRKAEQGCRVRFLLGAPDSEVTRARERVEDTALTLTMRIRITLEELERLGALEGVEARFSSAEDAPSHLSLSVFRFDAEALVTPHLARLVGHDSPMLHLRRMGGGGLFDRFSEHAEELWAGGVTV